MVTASGYSKIEVEKFKGYADKYIGNMMPYSELDVIGQPEEIDGASELFLVSYFPKVDFTLATDRQSNKVKGLYLGRYTEYRSPK